MSKNYTQFGNGELFQEVDQMLGSEKEQEVDETQLLHFKIEELQKICSSLTSANRKLLERIEQLEEELQNKNSSKTIFTDSYSELEIDFDEIEDLVKEYRNDLNKYQKKIELEFLQKTGKIDQLVEEIQFLRRNDYESNRRITELQNQNQALEETKQNLLMEIQDLQNSIKKNKFETPRYTKRQHEYPDYLTYNSESRTNGSDFNTNIQEELQKLIEKLMKELEHERLVKKKLTEEIKRIQKDMLDLEKQIMSKNNKIYILEINALKSAKNIFSPAINNKNNFPNNSAKYQKGSQIRQSKKARIMKNFTIMELIHEQLQITSRQKLIIGTKIIDLFMRKAQNNDLSELVLDQILITNFSQSTPYQLIVRINKNVENERMREQVNQSEFHLVWNLAFILDNLFTHTFEGEIHFGSTEKQAQILENINGLLQNRQENSFNHIIELKRLIDECLNYRRK